MLVFRIVLSKYDDGLIASGRAARWNSNDVNVIYTASSLSLGCLENVVHRSKLGLSANFSVLTIDIPDKLLVERIDINNLPISWNTFENMHLTQIIGNQWVKDAKTAILGVPSSIINEEFNYLINPAYPHFGKIKIISVKPFSFDDRIKD